ncbi:MAG TPA: 50S ribosomal protein L10 [Thermomicrobiales bacterium]|nr:50S ribosomal protein L10 [Thermomicrobiales bacterium]
MPTAQKAKQIDEIAESLERSQLTVVASYRGLTVTQLQDLRRGLRDSNAEFTVAKNTLTRIAAERVGVDIPGEHLEGPTALMFAYEDVVAPAKALNDYARASRGVLELKVGMMEGQTLTTSDIDVLASMPPREELLGKLVGMLASPMARAVGVLNGPSRSIAYLFNARAESVGGEGGEAQAAD